MSRNTSSTLNAHPISNSIYYKNSKDLLPLLDIVQSQISATDLIQQTTSDIIIKLIKKKTIIKYDLMIHAVAVIYVASRQCGRILVVKQLADQFNVSRKHLNKTIRSILYELDITPPSQRDLIYGLVRKVCNDFTLPNKTNDMMKLYDSLSGKSLFGGTNPRVIAAYLIREILVDETIQYDAILKNLNINPLSIWRLNKRMNSPSDKI